MAAYRHADHAGNFADLFKHTLLIALLTALRARGGPLAYFESHAGAGCYTPAPARARRLLALVELDTGSRPAAFAQLVGAFGGCAERMTYPGSPWLASTLLGARDRLWLVEQHPEPLARLRDLFADDARITCTRGDGFRAVPDLLPTGETPGLLFVDPPYARDDETDSVLSLMTETRLRWPHGTLAVWYPRRGDDVATRLREGLRARCVVEAIDCWIERPASRAHGMSGCGILLLDPPRGFTREWRTTGAWLATRLYREEAACCGVDRVV